MDMQEESYLLLQILRKLFKMLGKSLPNTYQQQLDELSKKDLPNRYTSEVGKSTKILMKEDYSSDFVIEPHSHLYELDIETLRRNFSWKGFLQSFINYMYKGIIQVCDSDFVYFDKLYRGLFEVLQHHKKKGTRTYCWKELKKTTTLIIEEKERIVSEQVEAENRKKTALIREFVLRIMDYVYKLTFIDMPRQLLRKLKEFPTNNLPDVVAKAIPLLLDDPELATKLGEVYFLDVRNALEACVFRSKFAALRCCEDKDFSLRVYESTVVEFTELQEQFPENTLWNHVQLAARNIVATYNGSTTNEKSEDTAKCEKNEDENLLNSDADNSDTRQLVEDPLPDNERKKNRSCCSS